MNVLTFVYIFLGGGIGSLMRFGGTILAVEKLGRSWPGTLLVNVLGSLIMVIFYKSLNALDQNLSAGIRIGFLGGLTTFSTFTYEIIYHIKTGDWKTALIIFALNIFFGIGVGIWVFR